MSEDAKQAEFDRVRNLALEHPDFKGAQKSAEEIARAWDEFQRSITGALREMGSQGDTLEENHMEGRARELQLWLEQTTNALLRKKLFSLMGQIGSENPPAKGSGPIEFPKGEPAPEPQEV